MSAAGEESARRRLPRGLIVVTVLAVLLGVAVLVYDTVGGAGRIALDDATISAPLLDLRTSAGGTLSDVLAAVGNEVDANRPIARVGSEVIAADVTGTVVSIREDVGAELAPGTVVASLIEPDDLRVVGLVDEDAGLSDLRVGQRADVKIDAFAGEEFPGSVEQISERPHRPAVSFSIADRNEQQQYEVKVRLDDTAGRELRQGMSAEIEVRR